MSCYFSLEFCQRAMLTFLTAPNFESGRKNRYVVVVEVTSGTGST